MNQTDCAQFDAIFIPPVTGSGTSAKIKENAAGFCMTKRNAGDSGGPSIGYSEIQLKIASGTGATECPSADTACCWSGAGSTSTAKNSAKNADGTTTYYCYEEKIDETAHSPLYSPNDYGSCKRTVCNYLAAKYACEHWKKGVSQEGDWGLPTKEQWENINTIVKYIEPCKDPKATQEGYAKYQCKGLKYNAKCTDTTKCTNTSYIQSYMGSSGLQLCDSSAGGYQVGAPRCYPQIGNVCKTAGGKKGCFPGTVWTSNNEYGATLESGNVQVGLYASYGANHKTMQLEVIHGLSTLGLSTRCVLKSWVE